MKKISAILGKSHNEFDHQLKDLLNDMCDAFDYLLLEQQKITEYQNKLFLKQHADVLQSPLCDVCHHKAEVVTIEVASGNYKSYCNKCLIK